MRRSFQLAALVASLGVGATAAPVTIDFEGLDVGTVVGSTFSGLGVTFDDAIVAENAIPGGSGTRFIWHETLTNAFGPTTPISVVFDTPQTLVSIVGVDVGFNGGQLLAFDAPVGGTQIDADSFTPASGNPEVTFVVNAVGIRRIEFSQIGAPNVNDGIAFDDLTFDAMAPVPLPPGGIMLLTAFAVLWIRRRPSPA